MKLSQLPAFVFAHCVILDPSRQVDGLNYMIKCLVDNNMEPRGVPFTEESCQNFQDHSVYHYPKPDVRTSYAHGPDPLCSSAVLDQRILIPGRSLPLEFRMPGSGCSQLLGGCSESSHVREFECARILLIRFCRVAYSERSYHRFRHLLSFASDGLWILFCGVCERVTAQVAPTHVVHGPNNTNYTVQSESKKSVDWTCQRAVQKTGPPSAS